MPVFPPRRTTRMSVGMRRGSWSPIIIDSSMCCGWFCVFKEWGGGGIRALSGDRHQDSPMKEEGQCTHDCHSMLSAVKED